LWDLQGTRKVGGALCVSRDLGGGAKRVAKEKINMFRELLKEAQDVFNPKVNEMGEQPSALVVNKFDQKEDPVKEYIDDDDDPENMDLDELLDLLYEKLDGVIDIAQMAAAKASEKGGEIDRVVAGQLESYFIGHMRSFQSNSNQPGSIRGLQSFLEDRSNYEDDEEEEYDEQEAIRRGETPIEKVLVKEASDHIPLKIMKTSKDGWMIQGASSQTGDRVFKSREEAISYAKELEKETKNLEAPRPYKIVKIENESIEEADEQTLNYRRDQLERLKISNEYNPSIKISDNNVSATNYMSISQNEFSAIKNVLVNGVAEPEEA